MPYNLRNSVWKIATMERMEFEHSSMAAAVKRNTEMIENVAFCYGFSLNGGSE